MVLFLTKQGTKVALKRGRVVVLDGDIQLSEFPAEKIERIVTFGRIKFTTPLLTWAMNKKVPIFFLSHNGKLKGSIVSHEWTYGTTTRKLYEFSSDPYLRLEFSKKLIANKIANSRTFFLILKRRWINVEDTVLDKLLAYKKVAKNAVNIDVLRGIEAQAAKVYFQEFSKLFEGWNMKGRSKHPPEDGINSLLSLGYTMLYTVVNSYLWMYGLEPSIGLYHEERSGFFPLAADLMEIFRAPVVDYLVFNLVYDGVFKQENFKKFGISGYRLKEEKFKEFLLHFRRRMEENNMHWHKEIIRVVNQLLQSVNKKEMLFKGYRWR